MKVQIDMSAFRTILFVSAASLLATGCNSLTTYGTGEDQQLASLKGIASLGGQQKRVDPGAMQNRSALVMPPDGNEALPTPASQKDQMALLGFTDPNDERFQEIMADGVITREERNALKLPADYVPPDTKREQYDMTNHQDVHRRLRNLRAASIENQKADLDENGLPRRRYLTDPPSELMVPSADAPSEFTKEELKATEPEEEKSFFKRIFD